MIIVFINNQIGTLYVLQYDPPSLTHPPVQQVIKMQSELEEQEIVAENDRDYDKIRGE